MNTFLNVKIKNIFEEKTYKAVVILLLLVLLTYRYCFIVDTDFQRDSEELAAGCIYSGIHGLDLNKYGLGKCSSLAGVMDADALVKGDYGLYNSGEFQNGVSTKAPEFAISYSAMDVCDEYGLLYCVPGNSVKFLNGQIRKIVDISKTDTYLFVTLEGEEPIDTKSCGGLADYRIVDQNGEELSNVIMSSYKSQVGLQGWIYYVTAKIISKPIVFRLLQAACAFFMAVVVLLMISQVQKKFGMPFALVFLFTFLLSPWIINFSRNLYWVEFTWFLPMLIGLYCSNHMEKRRLCYLLMFFAVAVKAACGYEYVTTIMLGGVLFQLIDFFTCKKEDRKKVFLTLVGLGVAAFLGFICVMIFHAYLRGDGSVADGLQNIWKQDVLRRTLGGNPEDFSGVYKASLNASILHVVLRYFRWSTPILVDFLPGILFPFLAAAPAVIFIYQKAVHKEVDKIFVWFYIFSFITTVSWYVLGKSHSFIHTHMNFVLWYFGFVQVCIYVVLKWFVEVMGLIRISSGKN